MRSCMGLAKPRPRCVQKVQPCPHHTHRLLLRPPAVPSSRPRPRFAPGAMAQCVRELSGLDVGPLTAALAASDAPFAPSQLYDRRAETNLVDESLRRSRFRELADKSILDLCEPLVRRASEEDPLHDYMLVRNNATHIVYGVRAPGAQHGHSTRPPAVDLPAPLRAPVSLQPQGRGSWGLNARNEAAGPPVQRCVAPGRASSVSHARHATPAAGPLTQPPAHRPCTPGPHPCSPATSSRPTRTTCPSPPTWSRSTP